MRIALIVNTGAGRHRGMNAAAIAERVFATGGWQVTRRVTANPEEAEALAREAATQGCDAVFACGGDGTLSAVVRGLKGTGVIAGIIPCGTGNDFARTIGLSRRPLLDAQQALLGYPAEVDLLEINGGKTWSLNVVGVGFDAGVAQRMNRRRRLTHGLTAYLTAVAQELISYRPIEVSVRAGRARWNGRALLVAAANARSYGAGMMIAPKADIADGLLDVVVIERVSRAAFLKHFPKLFKGTHLGHPAVHMWRTPECEIETSEPMPVLVDGDIQLSTPLHIRVAHRAARIWMPPATAIVPPRLRFQPSPEV